MPKKEVSITPSSRLGEERNNRSPTPIPGNVMMMRFPSSQQIYRKNHQETTF